MDNKYIAPVVAAVAGLWAGALGYDVIHEDVEATPEACVQAIEDADTAISNASQAFFHMSDFLTAATNNDLLGMEIATDDMAALTPVAERGIDDYRASKSECLALVDN